MTTKKIKSVKMNWKPITSELKELGFVGANVLDNERYLYIYRIYDPELSLFWDDEEKEFSLFNEVLNKTLYFTSKSHLKNFINAFKNPAKEGK